MLELITIYNKGEIDRKKYVEIKTLERYDKDGTFRTVTNIEIRSDKRAWKRITLVGIGENNKDFYRDGRIEPMDYKDAKKLYEQALTELPKAREKYGHIPDAVTYYF